MDLYNVPNDTGGDWRYKQCLNWIANFPSEIAPSAKLLFKEQNFTNDDIAWFVLIYSACYSYPSTVLMHKLLDYKTLTEEEFDKFWVEYKPKLIFQSDRRYIKNMNQFKHIVFEFLSRSNRQPYAYLNQFVSDSATKTYEAMYKEVSSWKYYGRFGIVLFMYNYMQMFNVPMDYSSYDWNNGSTTTAAIYHTLYLDEEANTFEKGGKRLSSETKDYFNKYLTKICNDLGKITGKHHSIIQVTSDLCSYRKLFKGSRYNGYYVDRQLEELNTLKTNFKGEPWAEQLLEFLMNARVKTVDAKFLGELNDWTGVRKWRFKEFLETGNIT